MNGTKGRRRDGRRGRRGTGISDRSKRLGPLFEDGRRAGYKQGFQAGNRDFTQPFAGTSIIIPSYNQREMLIECLDSIEAFTPQPFELIVVDDASTDGTAEAVKQRRNVRLAVHESNRGFAGAVNTGLMMAKGNTILLLNNDVLVAENWLGNMLSCLNSAPGIGAVGPVTNYIGGEQQVGVPYDAGDREGMWRFAAAHNVSCQARWRQTERLVGFCLLLNRETVQQTGYFDEGYRIGNYEDDDYIVRLRLQGLKLMIAGDAFIHHKGSVTMKGLGPQQFAETDSRNGSFFRQKWEDIYGRLATMEHPQERADGLPGTGAETLFAGGVAEAMPSGVLAQSSTGRLYWTYRKERYAAALSAGEAAELGLTPVRMSQRDLAALPLRGELQPDELKAAEQRLNVYAGQEWPPLQEGSIAELPDGRLFQIIDGKARPLISRYTAEAWGLAGRIRPASTRELALFPPGGPVLPPVQLLSAIL